MEMLWTLLLVASVALSVGADRLKAVESKDGSGFGSYDKNVPDGNEDEEWEEKQSEHSGGGVPLDGRMTVSVNQQPPNANNDGDPIDEEEEDPNAGGKNGGAGIVFEDDSSRPEGADSMNGEPVHVKENSLITHPGILAAIIVGGILVLVCLVVFFILIICCVRKKDEGTYDLDKAMKEKLKYITYTKADTSEKEFFA